MMNDATFDAEPTPTQQARIGALTLIQVDEIDAALQANCSAEWRKVARVVGTTMLQFGSRYRDVPDVYFAQRLAELVRDGRLESQGDMRMVRNGEVRLFSRIDGIRRAQQRLAKYKRPSESVVDELLRERREEAARE